MESFRSVRTWKLFELAFAATICASLAGCGVLAVAIQTIRPNDMPAKFKSLQQKRVVVVCRPVIELQFSNSNVPRELTHEVSVRLAKRVKKINLVDQREVAEWTDENSWHNFAEVGKALKADMVVGIDLEQFQLHQGPTLYQGEAALNLRVIDMQDGGQTVFSEPITSRYPPHTPIPASEKSEAEFRRQFLAVLAEQVSRNFYPHDSRADFAGDADLQ